MSNINLAAYDKLSAAFAYAQQMEKTGRKAIFMHEADTCPHTLWACPAAASSGG